MVGQNIDSYACYDVKKLAPKCMFSFFSFISILLHHNMGSKNIIFKALQDLSKEDETLFYCVL